MLNFIAAVYNEENEIDDLINHIYSDVDYMFIADDKSTDETVRKLENWTRWENLKFVVLPEHSGLPETVKNEALKMVPDGSWVIMLDADERFAEGTLDSMLRWLYPARNPVIKENHEVDNYTHVYFQQLEIIDGVHVRTFQKSKLFKKEAIRFSTGIHEDDQFEGPGIYKPEWIVLHRKTSDKQRQRETEYLKTYDKLFEEGKIDEGRRKWLRGLHHYVT